MEAIASFMNNPENGIETLTIGCVNWPEEYPYKPEVTVRIAHNGEELFLQYDVREKYTLAKVTEDNGAVWTDSCCEFFISFDDSGYYNLEMTCIGKALLGFRKTKEDATHGNSAVMNSIRRLSTLGTEPFEEKEGDNLWQLTAAIPASAFFRHDFKSLDGVKATVNAYKCGDNLSVPHFVSLFPIDFPKPNFHLPAFFREVSF